MGKEHSTCCPLGHKIKKLRMKGKDAPEEGFEVKGVAMGRLVNVAAGGDVI